MQRLKGRKILFGALAVLACSGDPTGNEGTPTEITASPEVVFVTQGDSEAVILTVVDEDGQILQADFEASNVGSGITVAEDPTFLEVTSANPIGRQARFFVKGVDLVATEFTINALGLSKTIQVTSVPGVLGAAFSNLAPLLGDTISLTAPPATFFNANSQLTFDGAPPVVVSQDATTILFIPFPNTFAPGVVSNVGVTSNPALTFTLSTPDTLVTDSIANIGENLSPLTPALGAPVTLVLPPGLKVIPESLVVSAGPPPTLGLQVANAPAAPLNVVPAGDSSSITFIPPPNSDSFVVVPGVIAARLPMYPLQLPTSVKLVTPRVDSIPANLSSTTPALGDPVTVSITDPAFAFTPGASVLVGGNPAFILARAGDGSSVTFVPRPASEGNVATDSVTIVGFALALPTQTPSMTLPSAEPVPGTGDPSTAPALTVPGVGATTTFFDDAVFSTPDNTGDGGVGVQFYSITVGAPTTMTIAISSTAGEPDLDGVLCNDAACSAPDFSVASTAHDEEAEVTLAAGTHFLAVVNFDGVATDWIRVAITR